VPTAELSAGPIHFEDTGGEGSVVVLVHGVLMDAAAWDGVLQGLRSRHRCIAPTLPLGGHRKPMRPDADLSNEGLSRLLAEFLEHLGLSEVTLVLNDWGGAQLIAELNLDARVGRLALVACEAFDNFPPRGPGRRLARAARIPGGLAVLSTLCRLAITRRIIAGSLASRPLPDDLVRQWLTPMRNPGIRRDLRRFCRSVPLDGRRNWSAGLTRFDKPSLVVWAEDDVMMPSEHGRMLVDLLPHAELVTMAKSRTLVPFDQPDALAHHLHRFMTGRPAVSPS
jgi:pimeloyl-ACP methyl ester carboxylesterase